MKRFIIFILIDCLCVCGLHARIMVDSAYVINDGFFQYLVNVDEDKYWCSCNKLICDSLPCFSVPDSIKVFDSSVPVRAVSDSAFMHCSASVINLPSTIKEIGNYAFSFCLNLKEVNMPDDVLRIGEGAFRNCYRLEKIKIPTGIKSIAPKTFYSCFSLKRIDIPNGVEVIEDDSFSYCGIERIYIPSSVKMLGSWNRSKDVFIGCSNMTHIEVDSKNKTYDSRGNCNAIIESSTNTLISGCGKTTIHRTIKQISLDAFSYRKNLESIYIPRGVIRIGNGAFRGCDNLKKIRVSSLNQNYSSGDNSNAIIDLKNKSLHTGCKTTTIPDDVNAIEEWAFSGLLSIDFLTIPEGVESIGEYAFSDCKGLQYIILPEKLNYIGNKAFIGCSALRSMVIPSGVKKINSGTFEDCFSLVFVELPISVKIANDAFKGCANLDVDYEY